MCNILMYGFEGEMRNIDLDTEEQMRRTTVQQLKAKTLEKFPRIREPENLRLCFNGVTLDSDTTLLSKYGIQKNSVIHLVLRVHGG